MVRGKTGPLGTTSTKCSICKHGERVRIELSIAKGLTRSAVARLFDVGKHSVGRHWDNHVSDTIKAARKLEVLKPGARLTALVQEEDIGFLERMAILRGALLSKLDIATELNDFSAVSSLTGQLMKLEQNVAKQTGELKRYAKTEHVHMVLTPDYQALCHRLMQALRPFPDAKRAAAEALRIGEEHLPQMIEAQAVNMTPSRG